MNGDIYLPVDTSNNLVNENLLQTLKLSDLDALNLAARYKATERYIEHPKTQEQMIKVQNNHLILRRNGFKLIFNCYKMRNDSYQMFLNRRIGSKLFDFIPVITENNYDAPLIIGISRNSDQIQNFILHRRRQHLKLNNSLATVINSTTNLLQKWKLISDLGFLTYRNLSTLYLPFRIGEQYHTLTGTWNKKIIKILDQSNQILLVNVEPNKPSFFGAQRGAYNSQTIRVHLQATNII